MINETLITLYKNHYNQEFSHVVKCGVVDEEVYQKTYPRIVLLLREPHTKEVFSIPNGLKRNVEKGLRKEKLEYKYMYTWRQAGVWAYAIIYGFQNYNSLKKDGYVVKGLQSIGMTNLKKCGGGARSNLRKIAYYANREKDLWLKELEIMKPHLVLCGGTYHDVVSNLGLDEIPLLEKNGTTYFYSVKKLGDVNSIILDFLHPANRKKRDDNLNILNDLIKGLHEKGFLLNG